MAFVAIFIAAYLCCPILFVGFRNVTAGWASMPKTSINEYCNSFFRENEIGFAGKVFRANLPASERVTNKQRAKTPLRCAIRARFYSAHIRGAALAWWSKRWQGTLHLQNIERL
jgi:hypothetical protein